jgi:hypothetical protein
LDAVNAINNLLPRPAFVTRTGGSHGGGAEVTDEGRRLILTFRRLEEKLGRISTAIAAEGLEHDQDLLFWGIGLKLSVRNALFCKIVKKPRSRRSACLLARNDELRALSQAKNQRPRTKEHAYIRRYNHVLRPY